MNTKTKECIEMLVSSHIDDLDLFMSHICNHTLILCKQLWGNRYITYTYGELYLTVLVICTKFNIAHDYEEFTFNMRDIEIINKIDKNRLKEMELNILRIVNWHPFDISCMYA